MDSDWSPAQSKSVERRQSVQWKAKAEELQDRVDFLEAALEAKSQSYEEDMGTLEERLSAARNWVRLALSNLREARTGVRAHKADNALLLFDAGIEHLDQALSAAPAGQVLFRGEAVLRHQKAGMERDIGWLNLGKHGEITIHGGKSSDGRRVVVTVYDPMPEEQRGD